MPILLKKLYSSSNGDRWSVVTESASGRRFVRHEANPASGGRVSEMDIEAFLDQNGSGPEYAALRKFLAEADSDGPSTLT